MVVTGFFVLCEAMRDWENSSRWIHRIVILDCLLHEIQSSSPACNENHAQEHIIILFARFPSLSLSLFYTTKHYVPHSNMAAKYCL